MIFRKVYKSDLSTVLSQFTRVTDGRADRRTEFSSLDRVYIPCSAVKTSQVTWCAFSRIWVQKGIIVSWRNFSYGQGSPT